MGEQEERTETATEVPCLFSQRWILAYFAFVGFIVVYMLRVNFSVAIVCMVRSANSSSSNVSLGYNATKAASYDCEDDLGEDVDYPGAEFDWDKSTTSGMLAAFFYGYIFTQTAGGYLADTYGGKRVWGIGILISVLCTVLLPVCARASMEMVFVLRVILGLASAVSFPAMHSMWGRWAPPLERSKLMAFCYTGAQVGNIVTFPLSGFLCSDGFDNGWGSIFYVTGAVGLLWTIAWFVFTTDNPHEHPRISKGEVNYITTAVGSSEPGERPPLPWKGIITSLPFWACLIAHVCWNWTSYTLITSLPTFFKEALKFDIKSNGLLAALPYICQSISAIITGQAADFLRTRGILSTTATRKVFQVASFIGAAVCLIGTGYITCDNRYVAVFTLSLAVIFGGLSRVGYLINHVDLAPRYAGILLGLTNTFATVPGMLAPIVAGKLTPDKTAEEWRYVFFVCAGFAVFGALIFGIFASGDEQHWSRGDTSKMYELNNETNESKRGL